MSNPDADLFIIIGLDTMASQEGSSYSIKSPLSYPNTKSPLLYVSKKMQ